MKRKTKAGDYTLSVQQTKLLINSETNFRNRTILKCLYYGGLRREETATMQVEDINFEQRYIKIIGKFDKLRYVPFMNAQFMGDLLTYIGKRKRGYVFIKEDGGFLTNRMINYICEQSGKKAGIINPHPNREHINPHMLRHTCARHLKNAGVPLEFVQNLLGHESYQMTMDVYGRMGFQDMIEYANKFTGLNPSKEKVKPGVHLLD